MAQAVTRWGLRSAACAAALFACAGFAACSSSDSGNGAKGTGSGGSGAGASGSGGLPFGNGGVPLPGGGGSASGLTDGGACASVTEGAEFLDLDMYLLIDKSSSMLEETSAGPSKWTAIERALEEFLNDPGSAGFGVGLQYFPRFKAGVPSTCRGDAECGVGAPCFLKTCANGSTLEVCSVDADCGFGDTCVDFGICEFYPIGGTPTYCAPLGGDCSPGYGRCLDIQDRWCINGTVCDAEPYATPDVAIAPLPGSAAPLVASLRGVTPEGRTPTGPALSGAISQAKTWATAHPGRQVVAVVATDGLPTECTPLDIGAVANIAATGLAGVPSVPTYVIGVFAPQDTESPQNLQAIARAGGTSRAFIVDTSQDVTAQFLAALDTIRSATRLSCELKLPEPRGGADLDYDEVNLELVPENGKKTQLANVRSPDRCNTAPGTGWYYDVDPSTGATPSKIQVCPDVCSAFGASKNAKVNLQIGCATIVR